MSPAPGAYGAVRDLPASFPVVLLNSAAAGRAFDSLAVANAQGARAMVRHLIALGHRRVAMIAGPARNSDAAGRLREIGRASCRGRVEISGVAVSLKKKTAKRCGGGGRGWFASPPRPHFRSTRP